MVAPRLTRRSLLKGSGILYGTTAAAGSAAALLAPSMAWALELKTLSQAEGDALLQMGRVLFPHEKLPDAAYALLVKDLDQAAAKDAATATLLREGIAQLDKAAGGSFVQADAARRLAVVQAMAGQPFFNTVRGKAVTSLYDNEIAFATFGYPGSSWEKGGLHPARLPGPELAARSAAHGEPTALSGLTVPQAPHPRCGARMAHPGIPPTATSNDKAQARPARRRQAWRHSISTTMQSSSSSARALAAARWPTSCARRASRWWCWRRAASSPTPASSTTSGSPSASWHGPTSARRRAAGASPRTSRNCPHGSARPWAARPPTGPARRCACSRTNSARTTYGRLEGANLLDWPITYKDLAPYYARAENKMGVTRTNGIPGLPGNNNFKVLYNGATRIGYKEVHTGNMAINSQPRDDRARCMQLVSASRAARAVPSGPPSTTELPAADATAIQRAAYRSARHPHRAQRRRPRQRGDLPRWRRQGAAPEGPPRAWRATPSRRRAAAAVGVEQVQGRAGQLVRPGGRNYMRHTTGSVYAAFKDPVHMYRGTTMAGIVRDEARNDTRRGFAGATRAGDHLAGRAVHGGPSWTRAPGAATSPGGWTTTPTWRACGSWERTCRARPTASR